MKASFELCDFTKAWERLQTLPYLDTQTGDREVWTVGWGHVLGPDDKRGVWTIDECEDAFLKDMAEAEAGVLRCVQAEWVLQQHELDALADFVFQYGVARLYESTLLKYILAGRMGAAAAEFTKWEKSGGVINKGVLRRSCARQAIFLCGDYSRKP